MTDRRVSSIVAIVVAMAAWSAQAQDAPQTNELFRRHYVEGQQLQYLMRAENNGNKYQVRITATTKRRDDGRFVEELAWHELESNGKARPLSPAAEAFRLEVTLDGGQPFVMPDLSKAPGLVGPVLDLLSFYSDQFLAIHQSSLRQRGDRVVVPIDLVPSWADGVNVILGEDHVHFDVTLTNVDVEARRAMLLVKHVPPAEPKIRIPAEWMRTPVAGTPNNWVQIRKRANRFEASVGRETFDVELTIDTADGSIVSATMDNPVTAITRDCADEVLSDCGDARATPTLRRIEMTRTDR